VRARCPKYATPRCVARAAPQQTIALPRGAPAQRRQSRRRDVVAPRVFYAADMKRPGTRYGGNRSIHHAVFTDATSSMRSRRRDAAPAMARPCVTACQRVRCYTMQTAHAARERTFDASNALERFTRRPLLFVTATELRGAFANHVSRARRRYSI